MAPGPGFEPGLTDPESAVLPLDDPGIALNAALWRKRVLRYHIFGCSATSGRATLASAANALRRLREECGKQLLLVVEQRREVALVRVVVRLAAGELVRHPARHSDRHVGIERTMPEVERLEGNVLKPESPLASVEPALVGSSLHPLSIRFSGGRTQLVDQAMG